MRYQATNLDEVRSIIREELERRTMNQNFVCQEMGFSEKHMSQMLTGGAGISIPMLFRFCNYLHISIIFQPTDL